MIKSVIRDMMFLSQKSTPADAADIKTAIDLHDTLAAHSSECVGMAANMIGVSKRIIVFNNQGMIMTMYNPEIISSSEPYKTEEGCLSLNGTRETTRFRKITVRYQDILFKWQEKQFLDWTAQIIQHEIDHCNGIII